MRETLMGESAKLTATLSEADVEELQAALALIDLMSRQSHGDGLTEFLVLQLDYTKMRMRPEKNHRRPHFHIEYKLEHSASYAIDNLECLAGCMPKRYEAPILAWAEKKRASLRATWDKLLNGEDVRELVLVKEKPQP